MGGGGEGEEGGERQRCREQSFIFPSEKKIRTNLRQSAPSSDRVAPIAIRSCWGEVSERGNSWGSLALYHNQRGESCT